jgi:transposase InsO family protein
VSAKFAFIDAEKAQYSILKMCTWMGVSTSGFYEWRDRPTSATGRRRVRLATLIEWIFNDSDHTYGHRRVHAALLRQGEQVTPELVRAIMRELGLTPCQPSPFRPTTTIGGDAHLIPDLVARDFHADAPGTKLVGDITSWVCRRVGMGPARWSARVLVEPLMGVSAGRHGPGAMVGQGAGRAAGGVITETSPAVAGL